MNSKSLISPFNFVTLQFTLLTQISHRYRQIFLCKSLRGSITSLLYIKHYTHKMFTSNAMQDSSLLCLLLHYQRASPTQRISYFVIYDMKHPNEMFSDAQHVDGGNFYIENFSSWKLKEREARLGRNIY